MPWLAAGMKGHHLAFSLQQMGSLGNNVAIQLSSALVMKARVKMHSWLHMLASPAYVSRKRHGMQQGSFCRQAQRAHELSA
jgi:hypothetical protein